MKGGYIILDIKKCQFALNEDNSDYISNNNYAKNIINAIRNGQKAVLVENLTSLGGSFAENMGSGFCRMATSGENYIKMELPNDAGTSIFFNNTGTISITN